MKEIVSNFYINSLILILSGYLIGSFPSAYIAGKIRKVNISKVGSKNIGGMNTFTSVGKLAGIIVIIADMGKGFLSVWLASKFSSHIAISLLTLAAAMAGHNWMIYIGFKGGKGLSTLIGGLLYLSFFSVLFLYIIFVPIFLFITKDVYLGQAAALFTFSFFIWGWEKNLWWLIFGLLATLIYFLKVLPLIKSYYSENRREVYGLLKKIFKPVFKNDK
jgi:glycerol-3-phosphate acyltransferase PlsY